MSSQRSMMAPIRHPDRFYIGGEWVKPATDATIEVVDSGNEEPYFRVAEATAADMAQAVSAARDAFDDGPWPRLTHVERAEYLSALGAGLRDRSDDLADLWSRESGILHPLARFAGAGAAETFEVHARLAETFPFEEAATPSTSDGHGLLVREPVGVVGAIIPWNGPLALMVNKLAPALLAGCSVVVKGSPEAPGAGYVVAEVAEAIGLPPGVLNVVTADREVSELLVRDQRVDKIAFTGSTAAGRRIASLCGERIARCTLELGGKSPAVILDDADIGAAAEYLAAAQCFISGQVCASLTRVIVPRNRHDEMVEALASCFSKIRVGDQFNERTQMGPLATRRQRERVDGFIAKGVQEGATLATGGGRPKDLERGWFVEPTVFADVETSATIAQEEIFGPVLSVIAAVDEEDAIAIANDTIYGLAAAVFTADADRARYVASRLRSGLVGHNAKAIDVVGAIRAGLGPDADPIDFNVALGGFKQSGIGREGGREGLFPYLETKTIVLAVPEI